MSNGDSDDTSEGCPRLHAYPISDTRAPRGVDVVSGEGLDEALVGADAIIDTARGPSPDQEEATAFFTASARNLQ